ncbi:Beta-1,3-galactosyl-O-glycosyl-glycoprotein beta-1,6-N-acetylglucosaminyltransferase [Lamellibrachia satsuma]|nr:Beta-1,3-galactosyl-O-glycosyl-glycoprotein beta-1,6-N-acetylglucosaminyltransferase [Lamellibrachia satsuma]
MIAKLRRNVKRYLYMAVFAVTSALVILNVLYVISDNPTVAYVTRYVRQDELVGYEEEQNYTENIALLHTEVAPRRHNDRLRHVDCAAMFRGDRAAIDRGREYVKTHARRPLSSDDYFAMAANCTRFRHARGYVTRPLSLEENDFPIAFSILMYKSVEQAERLLRAVYAPQNVYCIHVDSKACPTTLRALKAVSRCFPNVFVASRLESVYWGHISILLAEMNCLHDLMRYRWRYFINLSGEMFPLHTNAELVKILKLYDGANDIEGTFKRSHKPWIAMRHVVSWHLIRSFSVMLPTFFPKWKPPYDVTIYKGSNQAALTRGFAEYLLFNETATDLLAWFRDTLAPDEYLWPTLNHNPHLRAPGAYTGNPETKPFTARGTIWSSFADQIDWSWNHWDCRGKWVRQICIFGVGDLPWLYDRPELFANKFHSDFEYIVYDCIEDLIFNRTRDGHNRRFNGSYYERLPFVRNKEFVIAAGRGTRNSS